jgi:hypothetical protein
MLWKRFLSACAGLFCGHYLYWCYLCGKFPHETSGPQIFPAIVDIPIWVPIFFWPGCLFGHVARRFVAWLFRRDGARKFFFWVIFGGDVGVDTLEQKSGTDRSA